MKTGSEKTESFIQVILVLTSVISSTELDAFSKESADVQSRGHDAGSFVCNVILHSRLGINSQLDTLVDRSSKSPIVLCRILVVCIVFGIIDVVFRTVATKSFSCHFEFLCAETESHETEDPEEDSNSLRRDVFDGTNIDSLGWREKQELASRNASAEREGN